MLKVKNSSVVINRNLILDNLSFTVQSGSICYILGHNGSGKSTLLKAILGITRLSEGNIYLNDIDVNPYSRLQFLTFTGAMIEKASFYGHLTIRENLDIVRRYYNDIPYSRINYILDLMSCPVALQDRSCKYLSMGWKQRLGVGIAFMHNPRIILLDEPTSTLDPEAAASLLMLVSNMNYEHKTTFVISSHQLTEVNNLASQVIILKEGQLAFDSSVTNEMVKSTLWQDVYQKVNS